MEILFLLIGVIAGIFLGIIITYFLYYKNGKIVIDLTAGEDLPSFYIQFDNKKTLMKISKQHYVLLKTYVIRNRTDNILYYETKNSLKGV